MTDKRTLLMSDSANTKDALLRKILKVNFFYFIVGNLW